ncbi:MAG: metal ABC transporter ATP-binding protein [Acidimicrobiia bacterium]|jgi:ABC-type Mn2+/Zn2+ transport system ATPase subunit|nr:metal ABC transporter ATP-binding protein [Acidimicrobiia bacterium]MBA3801393.1 metal ABC transporter ATP-binding protein [Acidimicrobiia bacterium]
MASQPNNRGGRTVRADDLTVRFGATVALAPSSFRLAEATVTTLIGPNGSGKTTLLHALAGVTTPTGGRLDQPFGATTAFVGQLHHHHRWMPLSALEVVRMGRYRRLGLFSRFRRADHDAVADAASRADVEYLLAEPFGSLSGGQQQRVRIAQSLAGEPELLLLDEPVTGLDPPSQERVLEVIAAERARGTTVAFSTHHLDEAEMADQVLVLAGGVIAAGPPSSTLRPAVLSTAFAGKVLVIGDQFVLDEHGHDHAHERECLPADEHDA